MIVCRWPGCTRTQENSAFVDRGDGDFWCVDDHLLPDLPKLETGPLTLCAHCGLQCIHYAELTPVHERCLLAMTMGLVSMKAVGAYARRATR